MAAMKSGWGGPRRGAGRKPANSDEGTRRNRVVVMLTDTEIEQLKAIAEAAEAPVGTVAYNYVAAALKRRRKK
jgi:hypothetical protein